MKPIRRISVFLISFFLIFPLLSYSQWTWLNPKITIQNLNDVAFVDSLKGYICGDNGTLLKTTDGGSDWNIIDLDTTPDLTCIFKVNPSVIYIGGEHGVIMKSMNGGDYWRTLDSGFPLKINSIWFTSVDTGYGVGPVGAILKTTDGAETWTSGSLGQWTEFYSVCFTSKDTGYIAGRSGKIYKTNNGGETWHLCPTGTTDILYSLFFTSPDTGYVCGDYGALLKTTDAGESWFEPDGKPRTFGHFDVHFINNDTGFMAHESGYIYRTLNGGATWDAQNLLYSNMNAIGFIDQHKGFATGDYGVIYKTMDCGGNWSCNTSFYNRDFRDAFFLNSDTGFIAGVGAVFKTLDGGDSWIKLNLEGFYSSFTGLVFTDPDTGYIPSGQGRLIKTTDGGLTWNYIYTGFSENSTYYNLNIPGHDTLYVVGYRHILRSTDQGATWEEIFTTPFSGGNLYFFNNEVGVYKYDTLVYHTKDAGLTWSQFDQAPEGWAYFINPDTGYCLPGYGFLYITTNGGLSWELIYDFDLEPYDLIFPDATTGYACGSYGSLYKTTDAGYHWTQVETGTELPFYFINFTDTTTGFAGGEGGMLLKYQSSLPVSTPEITCAEKSVRVYPNPFSDQFNINFLVDFPVNVEVEIFDLSGKPMRHQAYGKLPAGNNSIVLDGNSLATGVYVINLKVGNQKYSIKILKL